MSEQKKVIWIIHNASSWKEVLKTKDLFKLIKVVKVADKFINSMIVFDKNFKFSTASDAISRSFNTREQMHKM